MNKLRFTLMALAVMASSLVVFSSAQAQSRTWVSGVGDDMNPCSRTAPCKTFSGAISKTAVNGEINCLDPGAFGALTITKSIQVDCHEVFAGVTNPATVESLLLLTVFPVPTRGSRCACATSIFPESTRDCVG